MAFGRRRDPRPTPDLQRVLDDAAAPGHDAELLGLTAATAAFVFASHAPEPALSWSLAKLITAPVLAVMALTATTGGVALAAATGNLPNTAQRLASHLGAPAPDADQTRSATATANLTKTNRGRCTAVTMGNKDSNGKALKAAPLSSAAAANCPARTAPGSQRSETATARLENKLAKPDSAGRPDSTGKPDTAPTGRPEGAGRPSDKPARPEGAGRPSDKPARS